MPVDRIERHAIEKSSLAIGGLAAMLASACCLGPLLLVILGVSGAWIGNLAMLEPYRPVFIAAAVIALLFAYRRIFQPVKACNPAEGCAVPRTRRAYRALFWVVTALVLVALAFPFVIPLFY